MKLLWLVTNRSHLTQKKAADRAPGAKDNSLFFLFNLSLIGNYCLHLPKRVSTGRLTRPTRSQTCNGCRDGC
ncbi:hypothetical protein GHT06_014144 [Daphnia sinensis]|uniref:Uncharacterized protein n=1 Tax=Daphnia sinensis TaxID=1820382 RepID=A0AAD5KT35_9CRUS|nr:hypothetical protein GHT06_014144 [Daphnia sinensis]